MVAKKLSWKTIFFSTRRSYKSVDANTVSKAGLTIGITGRKGSGFNSCSESERRIVNVESEEFMLEDGRPMTGGKFMGVAKVRTLRPTMRTTANYGGLHNCKAKKDRDSSARTVK